MGRNRAGPDSMVARPRSRVAKSAPHLLLEGGQTGCIDA